MTQEHHPSHCPHQHLFLTAAGCRVVFHSDTRASPLTLPTPTSLPHSGVHCRHALWGSGETPALAVLQHKIACLCFQWLCHNTMPSYLSDLLHPYLPLRTLRSLHTSLLTVPRFCLETYGKRSFSVFGPTVWNSLPLSLRKTQCFSTFKKKLKTYLFEKHLC